MGRMLLSGADLSEVIEVIKKLYIADREDWDQNFIENEVTEYFRVHVYPEKTGRRSMLREVEDWVRSNISNGPRCYDVAISLLACYQELGLKTPDEKSSCRMAFSRLVEKGKLEPMQKRSGLYRYINGKMEDIDFINADTTPFNIRFPLGVHEYVNIYRKSLILLAGSPDEGKTAYCLNLAHKNMKEHNILYFSSEMGAAELKVRLQKFPYPLIDWKVVNFKARSGDFQNAIDPNGFNIVDYLSVTKDFYEIGGKLKDLFDVLDKGIVFVCIQKPKGRDQGIGGERTLDIARLYLAVEGGILKIVKGKLWRQEAVNPKGLYCKFTLGGGANFKIIPDNDGADWRRA